MYSDRTIGAERDTPDSQKLRGNESGKGLLPRGREIIRDGKGYHTA